MRGLSLTEDLQKSPEYIALSAILSGHAAATDSQNAFCKGVESCFLANSNGAANVEASLLQAWWVVIATAAATDHRDSKQRQKLVDFLLSLQQRVNLEKDGKGCSVQGMTVWRDLPLFGWQMREAWNFAASDSSDRESQQQWINLNAWTAALLSAARDNDNKPDVSLYCIWTIRTALEDEQRPDNTALSAAAVWFGAAAPAIERFCRERKAFAGKVARPGALFPDQSWTGFTHDRWNSWSDRLKDVHSGVANEETAQLLETARQALRDVSQ